MGWFNDVLDPREWGDAVQDAFGTIGDVPESVGEWLTDQTGELLGLPQTAFDEMANWLDLENWWDTAWDLGMAGLNAWSGSQGREAMQQSQNQSEDFQREMWYRNMMQQQQFARQGIRMRVADARAAGLHPLAALGAQTTSFSPIAVGDPFTSSIPPSADVFRQAGQDINRARMARATEKERQANNAAVIAQNAQLARYRESQIQGQEIENAIALEQLQQMRNVPPPTPATEVNPKQEITRQENEPSTEAGDDPANKWVREPGGRIQRYPSEAVEDFVSEGFIPMMEWYLNNRLIPYFQGGGTPPPQSESRPGYKWRWDYIKGWHEVRMLK